MRSLGPIFAVIAALCFCAPGVARAQAPDCDPTINVNGVAVHVKEGLPSGVCGFTKQCIFPRVRCEGPVRLEKHTPTRRELVKCPLAPGQMRLHVVCLDPKLKKKRRR